MHKGFDVPQLRASEEWYVFIGHEYIYHINIGQSMYLSFRNYLEFMDTNMKSISRLLVVFSSLPLCTGYKFLLLAFASK